MNAIKMSAVLVMMALLLTLASCGPTYVRRGGGYGYGSRYGYGYRQPYYGGYNNGFYGYRRPPIIVAPAPRVYVRPYSGGRQGYGNYGNGGGGNYGGGRSYGGGGGYNGGGGGRSRGPR